MLMRIRTFFLLLSLVLMAGAWVGLRAEDAGTTTDAEAPSSSTHTSAKGATEEGMKGKEKKQPFKFTGQVLFLKREEQKSVTLMTDRFAPGGRELLNAKDYDFGWEPGADLAVSYRIGAFEPELRFMGLQEYEDKTSPFVSAAGGVIQFALPLGNTGLPQGISSTYESDFNSWELNLRYYPLERFHILAGGRQVKMEEDLRLFSDIGPGLNLATTHEKTATTWKGGQLGVGGEIVNWKDRVVLEGWGKGGYGESDLNTRGWLTQSAFPSSGFRWPSTDRDTGSWFAEAGAQVRVRICNHLYATGGYQALWLEKAALAPQQLRHANPLTTSTSGVSTDGVLFHGFKFGIRLTF